MFRDGFVEHLSVARIIAMTVMNSVTPKAAAKHDLLFNKPASVREKMFVNFSNFQFGAGSMLFHFNDRCQIKLVHFIKT